MKFKGVVESYLRFEGVISRLGKLSLDDKVIFEKLEPSKGDVQAIYKQIKGIGFKGSAIDYLCYISMLFIQINWLYSVEVITHRKIKDIVHLSNYEFKLRFFMQELFEACLRDESNARNMYRVFYKNPMLFFESVPFQEFLSAFPGVDKGELTRLCFNVIGSAHGLMRFGKGEEDIAEIFESGIKGLKKISLAPMYRARAEGNKDKEMLKLLPRESTVLDAIVDYLSQEEGGNKISSIKRTILGHFIRKGVKISEATVFHAVKGLAEVGLLKLVGTKGVGNNDVHTYELDRNLLGKVKIKIEKGLVRQTISSSIRSKGVKKKNKP